MTEFSNVDDVLDFAIANEQDAQRFYQELADHAAMGSNKELFLSFVVEEKKHEEKLRAIKAGGKLLNARAKILDLKIGDYLVDVEATPGMDFQDALIVAIILCFGDRPPAIGASTSSSATSTCPASMASPRAERSADCHASKR